MKQRIDYQQAEPRIYKAMAVADNQISFFNVDKGLMELIRLRASQLNGCGYCVNMHSKDALKAGESQQRVIAISAWWETPFFSEAERAALKLAEEVTQIYNKGLSEDTYQNVRKYFDETQISQMIFAIVVVNSWNRLAIATHMVAERDNQGLSQDTLGGGR